MELKANTKKTEHSLQQPSKLILEVSNNKMVIELLQNLCQSKNLAQNIPSIPSHSTPATISIVNESHAFLKHSQRESYCQKKLSDFWTSWYLTQILTIIWQENLWFGASQLFQLICTWLPCHFLLPAFITTHLPLFSWEEHNCCFAGSDVIWVSTGLSEPPLSNPDQGHSPSWMSMERQMFPPPSGAWAWPVQWQKMMLRFSNCSQDSERKFC